METHTPCTDCGAPLAADQEYCLECGARLVIPRRRLHWLWPSLAALAVAAGAATVAAAVGTADRHTIVALSRLRTAQTAAPAGDGLAAWQRGDAFTIAIATLPADRGSASATQRARRAARSGLHDVGVLASSGYASLHPGYLIVFSGAYGTADEAQAALPRAKRGFPNARVLRIVK